MIVADAGAILALMDLDNPEHIPLRSALLTGREQWVIPWAVLPELDHLVVKRLGRNAAEVLRADLAEGRYTVEWGGRSDLQRALELHRTYRDLSLDLVDAVVMAVAERLEARAIATLDLRDFGAVSLKGDPEIWPRDMQAIRGGAPLTP